MTRLIPAPSSPLGRRAFACVAVLAGALLLGACAKKGPPSGGPPDLDPPRIIDSAPDSGAAGVPRDVTPAITFSEGMEPRSSGDAVEIAPRVEIRQRRWAGRTLTVVFAESLKADQTYTLFVGGGARDRHGNNVQSGATVVFTTATEFPAGRIEGEILAVGFPAGGTYLWCYREGREPDSTARDFDALGLADAQGKFRIAGLTVPARYRIWAFADLNRNRSFEPNSDLLAAADTVFDLTTANPVAQSIVRVVNPRAPGRVRGGVIDSLGDDSGTLRLIAVADRDTSRRVTYELDERGGIDLKLDPGWYVLRAFRDLNGNKSWQSDAEAASEPERVRVDPAGDVQNLQFVLRRPPPPPAGSGP